MQSKKINLPMNTTRMSLVGSDAPIGRAPEFGAAARLQYEYWHSMEIATTPQSTASVAKAATASVLWGSTKRAISKECLIGLKNGQVFHRKYRPMKSQVVPHIWINSVRDVFKVTVGGESAMTLSLA
ncbi:hypothetical protein ACKVV7_011411 [Pyricularia oryzae]